MEDIPCSWIGRTNIVKMAILLEKIYMFNEIPTKIPMTLFADIVKLILKFIWKHKKTLNRQSKMSNNGYILIPDFKLYYRAIVIQTRYWHKAENANRTE
jgi:hypothetical protein